MHHNVIIVEVVQIDGDTLRGRVSGVHIGQDHIRAGTGEEVTSRRRCRFAHVEDIRGRSTRLIDETTRAGRVVERGSRHAAGGGVVLVGLRAL